ncbi:MAG: hypothetical protein JWM95_557 [Gemmatimonadetes bacterium]|nr:hypothetical protein [Gemmatimonadota bacterium]
MPANNYIAEWFGHRIYPTVMSSPESISDQCSKRCPFLSQVKVQHQECIKPPNAKGVCTVSSTSNGSRQDWVVCPYRVFEPSLIEPIASRLFDVLPTAVLRTHAAPTLASISVQNDILSELHAGNRVLIYFDQKLGGEISMRKTERSPEMSFDVTFVELLEKDGELYMGRFAIVEIQTMDFHGSYRHAVQKLTQAVNLFPTTYPTQIAANLDWASEGVEGPNIANVVKRTFWQMFFKFEFGQAAKCAGTALAIPASVWDSWQSSLSRPDLVPMQDGTFRLCVPGEAIPSTKPPAWIHVFDIDAGATTTPNPVTTQKVIGVVPGALEHFALKEAPRYASESLLAEAGIYHTLRRRLRAYWPERVLNPEP